MGVIGQSELINMGSIIACCVGMRRQERFHRHRCGVLVVVGVYTLLVLVLSRYQFPCMIPLVNGK